MKAGYRAKARWRRVTGWWCVWGLMVGFWAGSAGAGKEAEVKGGGSGERVRIEAVGAVFAVDAADIARRGRAAVLRDVFATRLRAVADDADTCVELARWALQNDLAEEYVLGLRTALLTDRGHREARKMLGDYRRRVYRLPYNDKAADKLRADMGVGFRIMRTDHFRICYSSTDLFAEITGELLESVYYAFTRFFEDRYFEPAPITDRLEVVLFDSREEFRRYAGRIDAAMAYSSGFYSGGSNRSYFYDSINDSEYSDYKGQFVGTQKRLKEQRRELQRNRGRNGSYLVTNPDGTEVEMSSGELLIELGRQEKALQGQLRQLKEAYRKVNINITVHEAVHHLAYSCGIHSRYYDNPKWLVEGLAMYFEAASEGYWREPGRLHERRLKAFVRTAGSSDRVSLKQLIRDDEQFNLNQSRAGAAYAATWSLFYYLANQEHKKLFDYMYELSLRLSDEAYSGGQRQKDFEKHFGDVEVFEYYWRRFMADIAREVE